MVAEIYEGCFCFIKKTDTILTPNIHELINT